MGIRSNLYAGQPGVTATTLVTSPASTVTTITYAHAYNTSADVVTLDASMNGIQVVSNMVLGPDEDAPIFGIVGGVLDATDTLTMTASAATTINVNISGYQVTTA